MAEDPQVTIQHSSDEEEKTEEVVVSGKRLNPKKGEETNKEVKEKKKDGDVNDFFYQGRCFQVRLN